ncbi:MAG TPA: hypothetical protein VGC05_11655, partial [Mycobacterium sp.]
ACGGSLVQFGWNAHSSWCGDLLGNAVSMTTRIVPAVVCGNTLLIRPSTIAALCTGRERSIVVRPVTSSSISEIVPAHSSPRRSWCTCGHRIVPQALQQIGIVDTGGVHGDHDRTQTR